MCGRVKFGGQFSRVWPPRRQKESSHFGRARDTRDRRRKAISIGHALPVCLRKTPWLARRSSKARREYSFFCIHFERLFHKSLTVADVACHVHRRQEVHFHRDKTVCPDTPHSGHPSRLNEKTSRSPSACPRLFAHREHVANYASRRPYR